MEEKDYKKTVVIIGQERSGTTMLINILDTLKIPTTGGPDWDDTQVRNILVSAHTNEDFDFESYADIKESAKDEFRRLMQQKNGELWAWKVPRFIFFWKELCPLIPNPKYIVIERGLNDTALSEIRLLKRYGVEMTKEEADIKIKKRAKIVGDFKKEHEHLLVTYENILANPEHEIKRIANYLLIRFRPEALTIPRVGYHD